MIGVVLATFSKEGNSNIESLCISLITSSENNMQIGASYVQQRGEQQQCSYVDSLCINIAPSTSVTACRGSASGKTYTCLLVYDHDRPLQHVRWCTQPYTCPWNSYKSCVARSIAHTVQHEECLWTAYTGSSVGPNLK